MKKRKIARTQGKTGLTREGKPHALYAVSTEYYSVLTGCMLPTSRIEDSR